MPALLSPEGQIETMMRELDCSGRNFVEVCKELNVQVSHGKFSEALNGKSQFDEQTARRLLEVANELRDLRTGFPDVPIDWSRWNRVAVLVVLARINKAAAEL
jgi:hypothetical protein